MQLQGTGQNMMRLEILVDRRYSGLFSMRLKLGQNLSEQLCHIIVERKQDGIASFSLNVKPNLAYNSSIQMYCLNLSFAERFFADSIRLLQHINWSMGSLLNAVSTDILEYPIVQLLLDGKSIRSLAVTSLYLSKTAE